MLLNLSLRDFVIVESLSLNLSEGFVVLSGETGAGKSIILNAIDLLLGDKADYTQIRKGSDNAQLSALFDIATLPELQQQLFEQGLAEENAGQLSLRRIIDVKGKSRSFINGQAVTLGQLKQIGSQLIDIHGQHAHQSLTQEQQQRYILDVFSGSLGQVAQVQVAYKAYREAREALEQVQTQHSALAQQRDSLLWQKQEFDQINPQENEWETLSSQYDILAHSAELISTAETVSEELDGDNGIQNLIANIERQLTSLAHIEPLFNDSLEMLASVQTEISEISGNMRDVLSHTDIDINELKHQELRMEQLSALAKKYRIDVEKLPEHHQYIITQLNELESAQDIEALREAVDKAHQAYCVVAEELTTTRRTGAEAFSQKVMNMMHELAMTGANFQVAVLPDKDTSHGQDKISYQVAMNAGSELRSLGKTASGGELARISLAVQVASGHSTRVPTLIFDEVDSGIGGRVAEIVGQKLCELGKNYQIIAITHLPQVASFGQQHWQVSKQDIDGQTISQINELSHDERIDELARMLGGSEITKTTREHAREMLNHSQQVIQ